MPTNPLTEALTKASHTAGFLIGELQEALKLTPEHEIALGILLLDLIESAAKLDQRTGQLARRSQAAPDAPAGAVLLATYPDPYLIRDGSVWLLKTHAKDLHCAPLTKDGTGFHLDELAEAYETDLLPQSEIDHIISALTPLSEDENNSSAEHKAGHSKA